MSALITNVIFNKQKHRNYIYGKEAYFLQSKIEKVPRDIRVEKSSKDMASSRNLVLTIGAQASPTMGDEPGVRKGNRSLLACPTRRKCSMETSQFGKSQTSVGHLIGEESGKLVSTIRAHASPPLPPPPPKRDGTRCPESKAFPVGMPHPLQMLHGNHS